MIDVTDPVEIKGLKEAFSYSFNGPLGEKTLEFLEQYCHFWLGGARDNLDQLQYEAGKRDVILTLKTIMREEWTPEQIATMFKRSNT
jgi:hypothetical protein